MANYAPKLLQFNTNQSIYALGETVELTNAWVYDANGYSDLEQVDFWLLKDGGSWQDINDTYSFTPWNDDSRWASFNKSLSGLADGDYDLWAIVYDQEGVSSNFHQVSFTVGNIAPTSLSFGTNQTTYNLGETVDLTSGWIYDANDYTDLDHIDFWLKQDGVWQDISDTYSFSPWSQDSRWASFDKSLTNLNAGEYMLWGKAYDNSGTASNYYQVSFKVENIAPTYLQFDTSQTSYNTDETVSITGGWVYDANSSSDLSRVDFWLQNPDGSWLDVSDVLNFTPWNSDNRWASFNYSVSNLSAGDYTLWAKAYDQSGAESNSVQKSFTVKIPHLVTADNLIFSGQEGDSGTFQIRLNQAPTSNVTLTLSMGDFLTVDADGTLSNGTQNEITFTANDWDIARTIWFIAEQDDSSANRTSNNTIHYTLSGGLTGSGTYTLGTIVNTYAPDNDQFNVDLDFRNDYLGYWTTERRQIAQQAADDWADLIASELSGLTLYDQSIHMVDQSSGFNFTTNRFIDDLVIFVGAYSDNSDPFEGASGKGGRRVGGSTQSNPLPRASMITVNTTGSMINEESDLNNTFNVEGNITVTGADILYSLVSHEIGHALGLLGNTYEGEQYVLGSGTSRFFTGVYSTAYYDDSIPMKSDNSGHPGNTVASIMSHGHWTQGILTPTELDRRFLADSGYQVYGINA
jgi:hypothetical protein